MDVKPYLDAYTFENNRLPVKKLLGKTYAAGLRDLLSRLKPAVVFIQEFSLITLQLLLLRRKFGFRLVSICDDNVDMIAGNDFSRFHRLARRWGFRLPEHAPFLDARGYGLLGCAL